MNDEIRTRLAGTGVWLRAAPGRFLSGLSRRTSLPPGFFIVLTLAVTVAVLTTTVVVAGVYRHFNSSRPMLVPSEPE